MLINTLLEKQQYTIYNTTYETHKQCILFICKSSLYVQRADQLWSAKITVNDSNRMVISC